MQQLPMMLAIINLIAQMQAQGSHEEIVLTKKCLEEPLVGV